MNALVSLLAGAADVQAPSEASARLLAYVADADSLALLTQAIPAMIPGEVRRGDIRAAIGDLQRRRAPHVLLVDIAGVVAPLAAMEELAQVCEPQVRVIAIGDSNDIGLYRDLRRLGVADYLFKPLTRDLLDGALRAATRDVAPEEAPGRLGKLVAVIGARGGVGTTTIAVNVASWLGESARRRTALVDLDLQGGSVALALNLKPEPALREAMEAPERVDDIFLERAMITVSERLAVLATEEAIDEAIGVEAPAALALLRRLQTRYNMVIVDAGRALCPVGRAVVAAAGVRVLVADASVPGLRDLVRLRGAFTGRAAGQRVVCVLNRRGAPGELAAADVARTLGGPPDHWLPHRPGALAVATGIGETAFAHCPRLGEALARLGADIAGRPATRAGLLQRWLGR